MDTGTVKVLSISEKISTRWEVLMSVGEEQYNFVFSVEKEQDEPNLLSIKESQQFNRLFQYNIHISSGVLQLLSKAIYRLEVNFPQILGQFLTSKQALAQQQEFDSQLIVG